MTKTTDLKSRFYEEGYELVDLTLEFKSTLVGLDKYVPTLIESWPAPELNRKTSILVLLTCTVSTGMFTFFQKYNLQEVVFSVLFSFCFVVVLFSTIRFIQKYLFLKKFTDKIEGALKNKVKPTKDQVARVKSVSPWFKSVGLLDSNIAGKLGLVVVVLSPKHPRLMFARDILI